MREHIRREAGHYVHSGWWLVPVAFATAAVAAVVMRGGEDPELSVSVLSVPAARPDPAVLPAVVAVPAGPAAQPPQEEPAVEVEHIQAF